MKFLLKLIGVNMDQGQGKHNIVRVTNASLIIMIFILIGCVSFVYKKHVINDYYLIAVDNEEQIMLSKKTPGGYSGRVSPIVKSVEYNDSIIVVERYSQKDKLIEFFIIFINLDGEYKKEEEYMVGPLQLDSCKNFLNEYQYSKGLIRIEP